MKLPHIIGGQSKYLFRICSRNNLGCCSKNYNKGTYSSIMVIESFSVSFENENKKSRI
jgi:hypothetical protein